MEARCTLATFGKARISKIVELGGKITGRRQCQRDPVHHRNLDIGQQEIEGAPVR